MHPCPLLFKKKLTIYENNFGTLFHFFRIFPSIAAKMVSRLTEAWPHAYNILAKACTSFTMNRKYDDTCPYKLLYRPFHCLLFLSPTWNLLHYHIISPRGEHLVDKTSLTPSFSIEVPVPSQECERVMYICARVSISSLTLIFFYCILIYFGTVLPVWYFFSFYYW